MNRPRSEPALCDSCGRFIGPADVCPYCGMEVRKSLGLRVLRWMALTLGIGGLAALYVASLHRENPVVAVKDMTPAMNFANVRIRGTVTREPDVRAKNGAPDYVAFTVDDGTGRIRVSANRKTARDIVAQKRLPAKGDRVEAGGSLSVSAEDCRLFIQAPGNLKTASQ